MATQTQHSPSITERYYNVSVPSRLKFTVQMKGDDGEIYYVFIYDEKDVKLWRQDRSTPLPRILGEMTVFKNPLKESIRATPEDLNRAFGNPRMDDAIQKILEEGHIVE